LGGESHTHFKGKWRGTLPIKDEIHFMGEPFRQHTTGHRRHHVLETGSMSHWMKWLKKTWEVRDVQVKRAIDVI
jgi:hypothetical protein